MVTADLGSAAWSLATCAKYGLDVTLLVINDDRLGSVAALQQARYGATSEVALVNPDIVGFARGLGMEADSTDDPERAAALVARGWQSTGPRLIELRMGVRAPW